jgi:hypothetical protein
MIYIICSVSKTVIVMFDKIEYNFKIEDKKCA